MKAWAERQRQGTAGHARFSLARTAQLLFELEVPAAPVQELGQVRLGRCPSPAGELQFALPAFSVAGRPLEFSGPAPAYGSSMPAWPDSGTAPMTERT